MLTRGASLDSRVSPPRLVRKGFINPSQLARDMGVTRCAISIGTPAAVGDSFYRNEIDSKGDGRCTCTKSKLFSPILLRFFS